MRSMNNLLIVFVLIFCVTFGYITYEFVISLPSSTSDAIIYSPNIPNDNQSVVILCFDDGWKSQMNMSEILDTFGFKATFGIVTSYVDGEYPAYVTWDEVKQLYNKGNDIESHSVTHPNLNNVSSAELDFELSQSQKVLKEQGYDSKLFIYPEGEGFDNNTVRNEVAKYYLSARTVEEGSFDINDTEFDRWAIPAYTITNMTNIDMFENVTDSAGGSEIVALVYHQLDSGTEYSVTTNDFTIQMAYLKSIGVTVETLNQLLFKIGV